MAKLGGYAGNILFVDLTANKIEKRPFSKDMARNFLGADGIDIKLLFDLVKPQTDPLSPENVLLFGTGPFVGTMLPSATSCSTCSAKH